MRFVIAFILACIVSALLFMMMYRLVNHDDAYIASDKPVMVNISRIKTPETKKQTKQEVEKTEPALAPLSIPPQLNTLENNANIQIPAMETEEWQDAELDTQQKYWSQPVGGNGNATSIDYIGERNAGKREITPISTRRPNIPDVAYENHINGWVLLAYTVKNDGSIKDIRVMDASPRGVFEANAVEALKTWRYQPFKGKEIYLSQRIDFDWNMYDYNMKFE